MLTLGRLPKGLDIARSLAQAGWRVLVAEPGKRHLCGSSRFVTRSFQVAKPVSHPQQYHEDLLNIIRDEGVDMVVPVSEECLHVAALHDRLPEGVRMLAMPPDELLAVHGKWSFVQICNALGIGAPKTCRLNDPGALDITQPNGVVVKQEFSCAGVGLAMVEAGQPLPQRENPQTWLVQERIVGKEVCTFSVADRGRVLGTVVYRGTVVSGTVAVCFERIDPDPEVTNWVTTFIEGSGCSGFIGLDLMVDNTGKVFGLECNPRATSGLHFFQADDLAQAIVTPEKCAELNVRPQRLLQQFYPCLTETQLSLPNLKKFLGNLGQLFRARDVTFMWSDPLPFLLLPYTAWSILSLTVFKGMSFGEAATWDVEWTPPAEVSN